MYNWKIKRINYICDKDLKTKDIPKVRIDIGEHIYNCYKRKWIFFWKLRRQLTDEEYIRLHNKITEDGYDIRRLYKHVNF